MLVKEIPKVLQSVKSIILTSTEIHIDYILGSVNKDRLNSASVEVYKTKIANFYLREYAIIVCYGYRLLLVAGDEQISRETLQKIKNILNAKKFFLKKFPIHRTHYYILCSIVAFYENKFEEADKILKLAVDANTSDCDWARFEIFREKARSFSERTTSNYVKQNRLRPSILLLSRDGSCILKVLVGIRFV